MADHARIVQRAEPEVPMSGFLWSAAVALVVVWLVAWLVLKVASGLIHLILIVAVVLIVINVIQRVRAKV